MGGRRPVVPCAEGHPLTTLSPPAPYHPERRVRLRWRRQPVCVGPGGQAHGEGRAGRIAGRDDRAGGRGTGGVRVDPRHHRVARWQPSRERPPAQRSPALRRRRQLPAGGAVASDGRPAASALGCVVGHASRTAPADPLRPGAGSRLRPRVWRRGRGRRAHDRGARPRWRRGGRRSPAGRVASPPAGARGRHDAHDQRAVLRAQA